VALISSPGPSRLRFLLLVVAIDAVFPISRLSEED